MQFIVRTDGASRGNPGKAAAAIVIASEDGVIWVQDSKYLGIATNNFAEYQAVKMALERLTSDFHERLPAQASFISDSQLVVNQLMGRFQIKNPELKKIYLEIKQLEKQVGEVKYSYAPRAENFLADKLANMALDAEG
jgi:ribonuclease HI